jgi:hypothetical protein
VKDEAAAPQEGAEGEKKVRHSAVVGVNNIFLLDSFNGCDW